MVLAMHSNASYLSKSSAQSWVGGHFFLLILRWKPSWQWRRSQHIQNSQGHHVQCSQRRTRSPLHQCMGSNPHATVTWRNGPQATAHSHPNWQQHSAQGSHQQHPTTMYQGNGHEIPLAMLLRHPRPIPILLAPRTRQPSQLLDKTSLRRSSHQKAPHYPNLKIHTRRPLSIHTTHPSYHRKRLNEIRTHRSRGS